MGHKHSRMYDVNDVMQRADDALLSAGTSYGFAVESYPPDRGYLYKLIEELSSEITELKLEIGELIRKFDENETSSIELREVSYEVAKSDVEEYFKSKGEAYPSGASADLNLDYKLVCKITDELQREGRLEVI